ncbi:hypothetical protein L21SP2_1833 [Salinispira pacifica]|uniref:Uncharacterized protein n=1 Tax=Salinispira pacifica TaxID=1307761 RepID=V5WHC4_9SPIO|nr:hypothetical protein L21SP2_1833 [Salinispira pacifica]
MPVSGNLFRAHKLKHYTIGKELTRKIPLLTMRLTSVNKYEVVPGQRV